MSSALQDLEELVVDAWPATETAELHGWLLRSSQGPSKRGNSVAPLQHDHARTTEQCIADVEAWYAERHATPRFHIGPSVRPKELPQLLLQRGYHETCATAFAAMPSFTLAAQRPPEDLRVRVVNDPTPAWFQVLEAGRFGHDLAGLRGFVRRLGTRCRFVGVADEVGRPLGAALGVASEERLGIYNMFTLPEARRRGAGRAMLQALAESALPDAIRELYLLVELENLPARALYAAAGFRDVYTYRYLEKSLPEVSQLHAAPTPQRPSRPT